MKFKDKTIVVTGGGSGIGRQVAEDLFSEGASVVIVGREKKKLEQAKKEILKKGSGKIWDISCDISSPEETQRLFHWIEKEGLVLSGLVNGAAVNPSRSDVLKTSFADWEETLSINLTGAFHCSKEAIRLMILSGGGSSMNRASIVNIASIAGITALPQRAAYMASKWGLVGLTKSMALDFASKNIRVNCVCPGYTQTPLVSKYLEGLPRDQYEDLVNAHPMRRLGTPHEISKSVLFLLSSDASWITGAILPVDGGYSTGKEY